MPVRPRRILIATLALIAGMLSVVGCGAGHSASSSSATPSTTATATSSGPLCPNGQTTCITQSPSARVRGSTVLTVNLTQAMRTSNPTLKQVALSCPQTSRYPIHCRLTGTETRPGRRGPVTGRVTVLGVFTGTHTYAYSVLYGPAHR